MKKPTRRTPRYRRQQRTGRPDDAFVELNGRRHYLGRHGSQESKQEYHRLLAEWTCNGGELPSDKPDVTVNSLMLRYCRHAEAYYRSPSGTPTQEIAAIKIALRPLRRLYGRSPVSSFGPRALKAVRQEMVGQGGSRQYINHQIGRIKRMFKWGVEEELVDPSILHGLQAVIGLKLGRCEVPEGPGVKPVPDAFVDAVRPFVSRQVWAMIELQGLTGARAGELVIMRPIDLDTTGRTWLFRPQHHKTAYQGRERTIYLGPRAQAVVQPFMAGRPVEAYLFSPAEAESERRSAMHAARTTPLSCGNKPGTNRKPKPGKQAGERYTTDSYRRAITYACDKAFPAPSEVKDDPIHLEAWRKEHRWHPHQLRHNAATYLRKEFGLEAAQLILGWSLPRNTSTTIRTATARRSAAAGTATSTGSASTTAPVHTTTPSTNTTGATAGS